MVLVEDKGLEVDPIFTVYSPNLLNGHCIPRLFWGLAVVGRARLDITLRFGAWLKMLCLTSAQPELWIYYFNTCADHGGSKQKEFWWKSSWGHTFYTHLDKWRFFTTSFLPYWDGVEFNRCTKRVVLDSGSAMILLMAYLLIKKVTTCGLVVKLLAFPLVDRLNFFYVPSKIGRDINTAKAILFVRKWDFQIAAHSWTPFMSQVSLNN